MKLVGDKIYVGSRHVGWWNGQVFRKVVWGSRHLFKKTDSWGIDAEVMEKLLYPKCAEIRILDKETGEVYVTNAVQYKLNGKFLHFKKDGADYGAQIFLERDKFGKST